MSVGPSGSSARIAWFEEAGAQAQRNRPAPAPDLPAPGGVVAASGRGQVTIDWQPVQGAIRGLQPGTYELRHRRVDTDHSNIVRTWERLGRPDWPDDAGWVRLRAADHLESLEPPRRVRPDEGRLELRLELPMPAMSLIELVPN